MPTADQLTFWTAIWANPDDDAPRLVYADWLQENGEPDRGEFITLQCRIAAARRQPKPRPPVPRTDTDRIQQLLKVHKTRWADPFARIVHGEYNPKDLKTARLRERWIHRLPYARGFVSELSLGLPDAARLVQADPELEPVGAVLIHDEMRTGEQHDMLAVLAGWLHGSCVRSLRLGNVTDLDLEAIVASRLTGLWELVLWPGTFGDAAVAKLAAWPAVASLQRLSLYSSEIGEDAAAALCDSPHIGQLQRLDLNWNRVSPATRKRLLDRFGTIPYLPRLQ